jgi:hypothetical protein
VTFPSNQSKLPEDPWTSVSFEGNRRQQLQQWAKIPFAEKIAWLEEAQRLADDFAKARPHIRPIVPPDSEKI